MVSTTFGWSQLFDSIRELLSFGSSGHSWVLASSERSRISVPIGVLDFWLRQALSGSGPKSALGFWPRWAFSGLGPYREVMDIGPVRTFLSFVFD